jgi:hypothetical protein
MSIGIGNEHEVFPLQVVLGVNEVLRVTADGQFVWNPDADRMIEEGDFSSSPALPHILRALRKRQWVGLTDEEIDDIWNRYCDEMGEASIDDAYDIARAIEAAHGIKEKNT